MKIKKLPLHEAQKIAAGEVIERPANIVKELVENAIDAQANKISIYTENAGKDLIRIVDNGQGMSLEDARYCFEKHTTSKISKVEDLYLINTFGFRGEALASVSAISKVTLVTKEEQTEQGIKLKVENCAIQNEEMVSCNTGADFSIKDMFYNVPARKKFLRSNDTEWRQILLLYQAFCLDYKHIHFQLFHDGRLVYNCPAVENLKNRISQIWSNKFEQNAIEFKAEALQDSLSLKGIISNHQYFRYDRSQIFLFVNKRWVKNIKLSQALIKGYSNVLPQGKFPGGFIFIEIDPEKIDINIHPKKEEVLFLNPRKIEQFIQDQVRKALESNLSRQIKKEVFISKENFNNHLDTKPNLDVIYPSQDFSFNTETPQKTTGFNFDKEPFMEETKSIETQTKLLIRDYELIGQFKKTYIIMEKEEGLFIVDQHAAQERILYEKFKNRFEEVATIKLLFPITITISKDDMKILEPHIGIFKDKGIELDIFGEDQIIITSTPIYLKNSNLEDLIHKVIGYINESQDLDEKEFFKAVNEKIHAQMACKAAVKAGDELNNEQMYQLLDDLSKTENRLTCPHGRPTNWLININELERKFKRQGQ